MELLAKFLNSEDLNHIHELPNHRKEPVNPVTNPEKHIDLSDKNLQEWNELVEGPTILEPLHLKTGASKKGVFKSSQGNTYIVKAYHEPLPKSITDYDIGGWAEMATQALFNAGDIGHLSQKSAVALHEGKPIIVTKFGKNMTSYEPPKDAPAINRLSLDATKIGMLDFLTNNNDRASTNILIKKDPNTETPIGLYAIDHAGNFQYKIPNIFGEQDVDSGTDHLQEYLRGDNDFNDFAGLRAWETPYLDHGIKWWTEYGPFVRKEMHNQLEGITDPQIKEHIRDNFNLRADALDRLALEWPDHRDSAIFSRNGGLSNLINVPIYRFKRED